uniref:Protein kinase domain-containing protein n=1 Tax=Rhabditophanes sp. KR3021 TaxID=114890 RepID=A0AC35TR59_9BILA
MHQSCSQSIEGTKVERTEFMKEFTLINKFEHPNIVKIFDLTPMMMVLELCSNGSLNSYLKNKMPPKHLQKYVANAARGMCYLATRHVIHRDIALRNLLVGSNDDVKISDFGLSVVSTVPIKAKD